MGNGTAGTMNGGSASAASVGTLTFSPNPFDPRGGVPLTISFGLGTAATVGGVVTDKHGNAVAILPAQVLPAGLGSMVWDGLDTKGHPTSPGTYTVSVTVTGGTGTVTRWASVQIMNNGGNVPASGNGSTPHGRGR